MNGDIGWLYPYYDENGKFVNKRFSPHGIIPYWKDSEKITLDYTIRIYSVKAYEGVKEVVVEKVKVYSTMNRTGKDYSKEDVEFIFNRDIIMNESEVIENASKSVGQIFDETIVANHP